VSGLVWRRTGGRHVADGYWPGQRYVLEKLQPDAAKPPFWRALFLAGGPALPISGAVGFQTARRAATRHFREVARS
jgi:hypothetical protein